ncbi:sulfide/dihydroorotate dehydrogenase-like FAD/NAD-binding protein [Serpentinicella sp. ANB-PHB4]|uniref:sulfide/dihydroorotate dehydrogenase-like FAD/NAD-binding protein n=1 Tax=Serpentinicella sp. ANB-PHB4 TaxID=3074076 RepID=UPI0028659204|nr:sulfide/dihydroorotate dehydrogenase-like FAD/NAD-binding protein [Serpentinicella sp. ANB-PHB4]MDR5658156.1 sulfide/dihydroorotate dehydrogenase-like FAD/NAD-binding protein [Serpentinicella sp. ANB-PHB4]
MTKKHTRCIDVGSEYCPCYLAETMDCITCSHLQDKKFCNCSWDGFCVYQEFKFCGNSVKNTRESIEVKIVKKEKFQKLIVITFKAPHTLARQLNQPGAYIFIRNKNMNHFFDIPMSIMDVDTFKNEVKIAVQVFGVKTKTIQDVEDSILVRGPYWNGLYGLENLKQIENPKPLIITRGVAQAPALLLIKYLSRRSENIDVVLDIGSPGHDFIRETDKVRIIENLDLFSNQAYKKLDKILADHSYNLVFVGASDYVYKQLIDHTQNLQDKKIITTNNSEICCGEGICGSCTTYDISGIPIKTCKTQLNIK